MAVLFRPRVLTRLAPRPGGGHVARAGGWVALGILEILTETDLTANFEGGLATQTQECPNGTGSLGCRSIQATRELFKEDPTICLKRLLEMC